MRRRLFSWQSGLAAALLLAPLAMGSAEADTTRVTVLPWEVPDEEAPRTSDDAPAGWGDSSWQGPATGKSNWHARYGADGDVLSTLFPGDAADMTISDLANISYWTKATSALDGKDWWVQIYTRWTGDGDEASWYGDKLTSNYNDHTHTGDWQLHSTDGSESDTGVMTFSDDGDGTEWTLADLGNDDYWGDLQVEMISVQTDSGWNGFDGYMDGLTIELTNENVGEVDFAPSPTAAMAGLAAFGMMGMSLRRPGRRRAEA